jgi:microcin C transport system substrate-binding protein
MFLVGPAWAEGVPALALRSTPKYPAGFSHLDYVNPDAPKGGEVRLAGLGTFDTLNPFTLKGIAAENAGLPFETLMEGSLDEPFSQYGKIAQSVTVAPDKSWISYKLRPEACFWDGTKITSADVLFSFETLRDKGHPFYRSYYKDVTKAEALGPDEVRFTFANTTNAELPLIMGQLPVLSKAFWVGKDFAATTLDPILGSGPYRVDKVEPGRSVAYRRVENWWGKDLPINKGRFNFDRIVVDYYRDATVAMEAFLAGRYDYRFENVARNWAIAYDTPAVKQGAIVKQEQKNETPSGMQGFIFNLRRPLFQDRRVRQAIDLAFDFAWGNKMVAYGAYQRTKSYFANSELAATGLPSADELKVLEPYRGRIPDEVFTQAYEPPTTDGSGDNRANLTKAAALLREAGWTLKNGKLVDAKGTPFRFDIVEESPLFERWTQPFIRNLERLGIDARMRIVDTAQYQSLVDAFAYDMIVHVFPASLSPGNELRDQWGSAKADQRGGKNLIGLKDPVVDDLVEKIIHVHDRAELVTLCRALDRVLLWQELVVPHWNSGVWRFASWDFFGQPKIAPRYGLGFPETWWIDPAKQAKASALRPK